mgnify:CR=1 FL=1
MCFVQLKLENLSPSPKSLRVKSKEGKGLWTVSQILWATNTTTLQLPTGWQYMVQIEAPSIPQSQVS